MVVALVVDLVVDVVVVVVAVVVVAEVLIGDVVVLENGVELVSIVEPN